jgi:hypothetical protein
MNEDKQAEPPPAPIITQPAPIKTTDTAEENLRVILKNSKQYHTLSMCQILGIYPA